MGHAPVEEFSNLRAQKWHFLRFPPDTIFRKQIMKKKAIFSCVFNISSFIGKVLCLREKRAKQLVMPSRRLQAKGEMSAQMGKYTKIMREVYQSSCFNDKSASRKCEINLILS